MIIYCIKTSRRHQFLKRLKRFPSLMWFSSACLSAGNLGQMPDLSWNYVCYLVTVYDHLWSEVTFAPCLVDPVMVVAVIISALSTILSFVPSVFCWFLAEHLEAWTLVLVARWLFCLMVGLLGANIVCLLFFGEVVWNELSGSLVWALKQRLKILPGCPMVKSWKKKIAYGYNI